MYPIYNKTLFNVLGITAIESWIGKMLRDLQNTTKNLDVVWLKFKVFKLEAKGFFTWFELTF